MADASGFLLLYLKDKEWELGGNPVFLVSLPESGPKTSRN